MGSSSMVGGAARRALILHRIAAAWDKRPDMRLGQLLVEVAYSYIDPESSIHSMEDMKLAELVERYVLLRPKPIDEEPITLVTCVICGESEREHENRPHKFVHPKESKR